MTGMSIILAPERAFIALGLLSGPTNQPRRNKIREVSSLLESYTSGRIALRFVLSVPAKATATRAQLMASERDLVLLDGRETPFRCGLKYVLWFSVAIKLFPKAAYLATGDDDAYIQLNHFESDLQSVYALAGVAPTLYGLFQWRSYYDNVTLDASTGFMGWGYTDGQAMNVRRSMEACREEVHAETTERRAELLSELLALRNKRGSNKAAAAANATSLRRLSARSVSKSKGGGGRQKRGGGGGGGGAAVASDVDLNSRYPKCASLSANEKRLSAILLGRVDWSLPPFPVANGPLFAVSRALASMLSADLSSKGGEGAHSSWLGPSAWATQLEATPLGQRWNASTQRGGPKEPKELGKRRCWPNSDSALGLFVVMSSLSRIPHTNLTLVNSPLGIQHYPWPVYSSNRGFSNRSIIFHGMKRNTSRAWAFAQSKASGPFIPLNRSCGGCGEMGWVSDPLSALRSWRCCGQRVAARVTRKSKHAAAQAWAKRASLPQGGPIKGLP